MFLGVWDQPWFRGTFLWKWHPDAGACASWWERRWPERMQRDFTPQGKPALEVSQEFYGRGRASP